MVEQCVIVLDGLGPHPAAPTRGLPAALRLVDGRPFVELLMSEARRRGFTRLVLLAGPATAAASAQMDHGAFGASVEVVIAPAALGSGGALANAHERLEETFLLLDGESWFDFNWLDLVTRTLARGADLGVALCLDRQGDGPAPPAGVAEPAGPSSPGGVYVLRKGAVADFVADFGPGASVRADLVPRQIAQGRAIAIPYPGFFIDMADPEAYARAQGTVPLRRRRPAVFFDRDGVLNVDTGYPHSSADIRWIEGAPAAVKRFNDLGYYTFVVTNQAGVARGYYPESAIAPLHAWMNAQLRALGAGIDDWRYCPYHPQGSVPDYARAHPWRKPEPGMLIDLMTHWPVDRTASLLIGDKPSDLEAARAAGITGHLFTGGNLLAFVEALHPEAACAALP